MDNLWCQSLHSEIEMRIILFNWRENCTTLSQAWKAEEKNGHTAFGRSFGRIIQ